MVFACRDKAFSINRQGRCVQPRELFWKWCRFIFLYKYLCQTISMVEYWRLGNVSPSEKNKPGIIFFWFIPSFLQWGAGWVCFSLPCCCSLLCEPGRQPSHRTEQVGRLTWISTEIVSHPPESLKEVPNPHAACKAHSSIPQMRGKGQPVLPHSGTVCPRNL